MVSPDDESAKTICEVNPEPTGRPDRLSAADVT